MTTNSRRRLTALANLLCALLLAVFAIGLLWGWFVQ